MKCGKLPSEACENPVGLCMYEGHMETVEYIWVNVRCMLDWILSPNCRNILCLQIEDQPVRIAKNESQFYLPDLGIRNWLH